MNFLSTFFRASFLNGFSVEIFGGFFKSLPLAWQNPNQKMKLNFRNETVADFFQLSYNRFQTSMVNGLSASPLMRTTLSWPRTVDRTVIWKLSSFDSIWCWLCISISLIIQVVVSPYSFDESIFSCLFNNFQKYTWYLQPGLGTIASKQEAKLGCFHIFWKP